MNIEDKFEALRFLTHNLPPDMKQLMEYEKKSPEFAMIVKTLTQLILQLQYSPSEVRAAAMYACYKAEMLCVQPTFMERYLHERNKR